MQHSDGKLEGIARAESICPNDGMCLSVDWGRSSTEPSNDLACSTSGGTLSRLKLTDTDLRQDMTWAAHDAEVWMCSFDAWNANVLYSGADDCVLKVWDQRAGTAVPCAVNRKSHTMGVCCMESSPHEEHVLATGSYDEKIRVWDMRNLCLPVLTRDVCVGGGVWRVKWHPTDPTLLLSAAMHGGFAVVKNAAGGLSLQDTWPGTLGYGVDWYRGDVRLRCGWRALVGFSLAGTCSFYDRVFQLRSFAH